MLTRSLLRGCSAFIAFFALCLSATSGGRAQDILKELEQADHEAAKKPAGHNHEHHAAPGSKKKKPPKEDKEHRGHKHAVSQENKKHGGHRPREQPPGLMMECIRVRECMEINMQCMASSGPIRYSEKGPVQAGCPIQRPISGCTATFGEWQTMYHALFNLVYDHQGGPRGATKHS